MATACTNEDALVANPADNGTDEVKMITETISATNGDEATRADVAADAKFTWSTGDQIAVHVSDGKYYTTAALAAGGSKSAEFTVTYPDGQARDAFAVYPASIVSASAANYGQSGSPLDVTLPGSYTLAQVSGTTTPCPMIATNTPGSGWTFKQLCGLVRLTVNSVPPTATSLKIDFNGKKVQGAFSIASDVTPGTSTIATSATDGTDDIITITDLGISSWTDGMVLNLPLPTGEYTKVTVTAYNSSDKAILTITRPFMSSGTYTAARAKGRKVTASLPVFSVSATKRVIFAPGNLQATYNASAQTWTWGFAANQYDIIGNASGNKTITTETKESSEPYAKLSANGTVTLFGRSTSSTYYGIAWSNNEANYTGAFVDWGNIDIDGNGANYWRTLSEAEWQYVVGEGTYRHNGGSIQWRVGSSTYVVLNALCTKATVNGVNGFILFPDYYAGGMPSGVTWVQNAISSGNMSNSGTDGWGATVNASGWISLEKEGCVFLPVEGFRLGYYSGSYNVIANVTQGYYMSSNSTVLRFNDDGFDPNQGLSGFEYSGRSVRLVHEP